MHNLVRRIDLVLAVAVTLLVVQGLRLHYHVHLDGPVDHAPRASAHVADLMEDGERHDRLLEVDNGDGVLLKLFKLAGYDTPAPVASVVLLAALGAFRVPPGHSRLVVPRTPHALKPPLRAPPR